MNEGPAQTTETDQDIVTVQGSVCTWLCDAEFAAALGAPVAPDQPKDWEGESAAAWELIKESKVRTVRRGVLGGGRVFWKTFRPVRLSDRARDRLDGARGVKELENLLEARRRGLPTVRPLAAGRVSGEAGQASFLVTEAWAADPVGDRGWEPDLSAALGALLKQVHDGGLHARDLHPGNVLRADDGSLRLVDLTSSAFADPLENDERATALAFFCHALDGGVGDPAADGLRQAYGGSDRLWRLAGQASGRLRLRMLRAFGGRAFRECRHTRVERETGGVKWFVARIRDVEAGSALEHARDFVGLAERPAAVREGRRGGVWRTGPLFVKDREAGPAKRLFRAAYWLQHAGVATPEPIALRLESGSRKSRGLVFTRALEAAHLGDEWESGRLDASALSRVATDLGELCGRLHGFGLRCRDLKLENLVRDPAGGRVHLVDLDGVRRKHAQDPRGEGRDLGRLLAAFEKALGKREAAPIRAFWHSYLRTRAGLGNALQGPSPQRLRQRTEARANEWWRDHR